MSRFSNKVMGLRGLVCLGAWVALSACTDGTPMNNPHSSGALASNTLFAAFQGTSPKYLDPTASYALNETPITYSVYEPLYRFHYLKRPYVLAPRTAEHVVAPKYYDHDGKPLPQEAPGERVARAIYDIPIKRGILFAPHPAFAKDAQGQYLYHALTPEELSGKRTPFDFAVHGTRTLTAHDYVYAIRRLATPRVRSPLFSLMAEHIVGLKEYGARLAQADQALRAQLGPGAREAPFLDLRDHPFEGASALDDYTLRIELNGKYPQFKYWLQMAFFAPIPWEAEKFYAQPGMAERNLSLNDWPVGSGPFMLVESVPNRRHVLARNPNFRGEPYPCEGTEADRAVGWLDDCGKTMPFLDRVVMTIEKEHQPHRTKFLQGYYDTPGVVQFGWLLGFEVDLKNSEQMRALFDERAIKMARMTEISNWYLGFNWLDPVVGGGDTAEQRVKNRKLRQAISIAIDWQEYMRVFDHKASGVPAMGPVPPGVFGFRPDDMNPVVYQRVDGAVQRQPLSQAKALLAQAGYPEGRDARTGRPLVLNYDFPVALTPELKSEIDWMTKQFARIGVQLEVRATDFNRFQEKAQKGALQLFWAGWSADYPDAENFLFLLYGPNAKALTGGNGENTANYQNKEYDSLYEEMRYLDDGPRKQAVIDRMVEIAREDAPWVFSFNTYAGVVHHAWVSNVVPNQLSGDRLLYFKVNAPMRVQNVAAWNRPALWPFALLVLLLLGLGALMVRAYRAREQRTAWRTP